MILRVVRLRNFASAALLVAVFGIATNWRATARPLDAVMLPERDEQEATASLAGGDALRQRRSFITADGVKIARRGDPGTPQARTWVSLEPGWIVCDRRGASGRLVGIAVEYQAARVH
jgi:hypothetical protein